MQFKKIFTGVLDCDTYHILPETNNSNAVSNYKSNPQLHKKSFQIWRGVKIRIISLYRCNGV